jgi:hypothetical protein
LLSQTRPADFAGFEEAAGLQDVIGSVPAGADSNMAAPSDAELEQAWQGDIYGLSAPEYTVGPDDLYAMRPVSERLGSGEQDAWKAPPEQGLMGTLSDIWDDPYLPRIEKVRQGIQAVFAPDQYKAEQQHSPFEWGAVATGWAKGIWNTTADTINTANMIGYVTSPASMLSGVEPVFLPKADLDSAELRGSGGVQALSWVGGFSAMVRGRGLASPNSNTSLIPGLERPFRTVEPTRIENSVLQRFQSSEFLSKADDFCIDCSQLADDLIQNSSRGSLVRITPSSGNQVVIPETVNGKIIGTEFDNHFIFTNGKAVFDPRLSTDPIPKGDYSRLIRHLNPDGVVFEQEIFKQSTGVQFKPTKF